MKNLGELIVALKEIRKGGYYLTHRAHDTGIGKTLEDLLDIKENNLRLPDVGEIELKAKRIGSGSMLTLATKSPEPRGVNRKLFDRYKYLDAEGYYNLHSTVYGNRFNPQGFKLDFREGRFILENKDNLEAYWPLTFFDDVLVSKSDKILLVLAETRGERKTSGEKFHYVEAYLLSKLNRSKFEEAIRSGTLRVDIRIGTYRSGKSKGKYHDHGTGLRIHRNAFLQLYDSYEQLM